MRVIILFVTMAIFLSAETNSKLCNEIKADSAKFFSKKLDLEKDYLEISQMDCACEGSLFLMDFLQNLYNISTKIRGDSIDCNGRYAIANQKFFQYTLAKAGIAPENYKKDLLPNEIYDNLITKNRKYFRTWAHKSIGNHILHNQFNTEYQKAIPKLVKYYKDKFGYDEGSAIYFAVRAANEYLNYSVGNYNVDIKFSELEEMMSDPSLTIEDLKGYIYSHEISQLELNNALNIAILENKDVEFLDVLIKRGANINSGDESALFFALKNIKLAKFLISQGADVNYKNSFGKTPIFYAVEFKNMDLIKFLIEHGADLNAKYISNNEKMAFAATSYEPFYQNLCALNHTSKTLLMHAAQNSNLEIVELLIENRAKIDSLDDLGNNALDYADTAKNKEIIAYLLSLGLKLNTTQGEIYE